MEAAWLVVICGSILLALSAMCTSVDRHQRGHARSEHAQLGMWSGQAIYVGSYTCVLSASGVMWVAVDAWRLVIWCNVDS